MSDKENQDPKPKKRVKRKLTVREKPAKVAKNAYRYGDVSLLCQDSARLYTFLYERKLLHNQGSTCPFCLEGNFKLVSVGEKKKTDDFQWRCGKKSCRRKLSTRKDSWFSKSRLSISTIVQLTYCWSQRYPQYILEHELGVSPTTLVDWNNFCREVCSLIRAKAEPIGGPGCEVEIDESKFGKRKNNKGKQVQGVWVFGGWERNSESGFMECVPKRDAATLVPIIQKWIKPGTKIHSDCWGAYLHLSDYGYEHVTVNHSKEFYNKENNACTNTIESCWRAVKGSLPKYGTTKALYQSYIDEYLVRRRMLRGKSDKFLGFLDLIAKVYAKGEETGEQTDNSVLDVSADLFD